MTTSCEALISFLLDVFPCTVIDFDGQVVADGVRMAIFLLILRLWDNNHLPYMVMLFHVQATRRSLKPCIF